MSKGKYSPSLTRKMINDCDYVNGFTFNADKNVPPEYIKTRGDVWDTRIHFGTYDEDGFDRYGYSAFDRDGNYIGIGEGIDRWGNTEMDYLSMGDDEFEDICSRGC